MGTMQACVVCSSSEDVNKDMFSQLFESERGADITLLVGSENAMERIPAHSWVLSHSNDYFRSLLVGPLRNPSQNTFTIPDVHPSHFINLIRWLYGCGCVAEGTQSALGTLKVAIEFLCPELVLHIVDHLSRKLKPSNVLQILAWADLYAPNTLPSAPPLCNDPRDNIQGDCQRLYPSLNPPSKAFHVSMSEPHHLGHQCKPSLHRLKSAPGRIIVADPTEACAILVRNCWSHINAHAVEVLSSENLESIPHSLLLKVLRSDSLVVPDESLILDAMFRWSSAQCRREHQPMTLTGRRQVLADILTTPRLLTLSAQQVHLMEKFYTSEEIEFVKQKIKKKSSCPNVPSLFHDVVNEMARPRNQVNNGSHGAPDGRRQKNTKKDFIMNFVSIIALAID
ncbi:BTB/POZ domain-containing protein 9-like [Hyalella azteca]|uniref:BTB/POZ domain-containing protein 9-like n=1 Tax=Hyalella azteca TaxID=294128 RepID=A0A8B7P2B1_HYAAZ|nr:BTB/POZ domain-containing protein 9-like [Hyalella azteca]